MELMQTTYRASLSAAQMWANGAESRIQRRPIRDSLCLLTGAGGNILILPGPDGSLAVDSGLVSAAPHLTEALKHLAIRPVRHLVNTHWHFDHTGGNVWMSKAGAAIIAHENSRIRMGSFQAIPAFDVVVPPSPNAALPTIVFPYKQTITVDGETVELRRHTPAHTDTDISVFFAKANVLHTGDTWFSGIYPFIDYDSGGSIRGLVVASTENISLADSETVVVPGHGETGSRKDLLNFREMLLTVCDSVAILKGSGRSLEAVIAEKPTARFDEQWGGGFVTPELFTSLVYRGL